MLINTNSNDFVIDRRVVWKPVSSSYKSRRARDAIQEDKNKTTQMLAQRRRVKLTSPFTLSFLSSQPQSSRLPTTRMRQSLDIKNLKLEIFAKIRALLERNNLEKVEHSWIDCHAHISFRIQCS